MKGCVYWDAKKDPERIKEGEEKVYQKYHRASSREF